MSLSYTSEHSSGCLPPYSESTVGFLGFFFIDQDSSRNKLQSSGKVSSGSCSEDSCFLSNVYWPLLIVLISQSLLNLSIWFINSWYNPVTDANHQIYRAANIRCHCLHRSKTLLKAYTLRSLSPSKVVCIGRIILFKGVGLLLLKSNSLYIK
jgi:hypothetical protein